MASCWSRGTVPVYAVPREEIDSSCLGCFRAAFLVKSTEASGVMVGVA